MFTGHGNEWISLQLIVLLIQQTDTVMREAIPIDVRLDITLRYLATGESFRSLEFNFWVSRKAISYIVMEVCTALKRALSDYLKVPKSPEEWLNVARQYTDMCNYPNCIGTLRYSVMTIVTTATDQKTQNEWFLLQLYRCIGWKTHCHWTTTKLRISLL